MENIAPKFMVAKCSFFVSKMFLGVTFWEHNRLLKHDMGRAKENFTCCINDAIRFF